MTTESARSMRASRETTGRTLGQTLLVIAGVLRPTSLELLTGFVMERVGREIEPADAGTSHGALLAGRGHV